MEAKIEEMASCKDVTGLIQMASEGDCMVQEQVRYALESIGPEAVPELINSLRSTNKAARYSAIIALGDIADQRAVVPLGRVLLTDREKCIRCCAARALSHHREEQATQFMLQALLMDRECCVRHVARRALECQYGEDELLNMLLMALDCSDPETSAAAALALGSIGDQRALEPLVEKTLESDRFLQRCAQWAIQRLQDRTTPPFEWYPQICSDLIVP